MPITSNSALRKLRNGEMAIGFGVHHLRSAATAMLARATGFDWLFIDTEHGAHSVQEATQLCLAALPTGVTPIVRVCSDALDEGTRALDNGAMGIVVPHVDTPKQARRLAEAFRFPPSGHRSWGGPPAIYGFQPPDSATAQREINEEILICAMIETPEAVENAAEIAQVEGIDVLMIGTSDLSAELGVSGQLGHPKVQDAYRHLAKICHKHGRVLGMGGVYDEEWAAQYIAMGARFLLGIGDHAALMAGLSARAKFLHGLPTNALPDHAPAEVPPEIVAKAGKEAKSV
jgi:2-keto-3-deoxy-L-rhamnonate aldolase RhmA